MEPSGGSGAGIRTHDYVESGSDRSTGGFTRAAALAVTVILLPWALVRRALRVSAGLLARAGSLVVMGTGRLSAGVAAAARLVGRWTSALVRPIVSALRRTWHGLSMVAAALLQAAIRPLGPIRRALAAGARWTAGLAATVLSATWHSIARAGGAVGRVAAIVLVALWRVVSEAAALGRIAATVLGRAWSVLTWAGRLTACVAAAVFGRFWSVLVWAGRLTASVGRLVFRAAAGVFGRVWSVLTWAGRLTARVGRLVDRAAVAVLAPVLRALRASLVAALRLAVSLGRRLWVPGLLAWRSCIREIGRAHV